MSTALTLDSLGTLGGPVTLGATGLPTGATCTFSSPSVDVAGGPATVTVTISTTRNTPALGQTRSGSPFGGAGALMAFGLFLLTFSRRRKRASVCLSGVAMALLAGTMACAISGGSFSGGATGAAGGTPPGTYTVTVTASAPGAAEVSTSIPLVVQ